MTIVEFIEERLEEREDDIYFRPYIQFFRRVLRLHKSWPVLVEKEPVFEVPPWEDAFGNVIYRMTQEIGWFTEEGYRKVFGTEPPTAPMIKAMATIFQYHIDFKEEWRFHD